MRGSRITRALGGICYLSTLLMVSSPSQAQSATGKTRVYYVAADEIQWDYAPAGRDEAMGRPFDALQKGYGESGPHKLGRVCKKAVFREYTDENFSKLKARAPEDAYLGLLGPILRAEIGD